MINLNRFDLASLRLYVAVVDAGSLTAGADRFGISLAAAGKRIAGLEQHCGMALLERSQRGVTATSNGQTLHRHAIEVVARLEQLAVAVEDFQCGTAGHLRLCANPSALGGFLPQLFAQSVAHHPDVKIDLEDALSEQAVRALTVGTAEVAIIGDNTPIDGLATLVAILPKAESGMLGWRPEADLGGQPRVEGRFTLAGASFRIFRVARKDALCKCATASIPLDRWVRRFHAKCAEPSPR